MFKGRDNQITCLRYADDLVFICKTIHRHCHQHQPIHREARVARNRNDAKLEID
ncbi:hypothetical protein [Nostoc sp.]|uniref:hypothetical protein n=1 Tax=Nostoc sp. TaxID=1180 RepID=UPI003FA5EEFC